METKWNVTPLIGDFGGRVGIYRFLQSPPIPRRLPSLMVNKYLAQLSTLMAHSIKESFNQLVLQSEEEGQTTISVTKNELKILFTLKIGMTISTGNFLL